MKSKDKKDTLRKMKMEVEHAKFMGCNKSSSKIDIHQQWITNTSEKSKTLNQPNTYLKEVEE